jgi:hypothetical protein
MEDREHKVRQRAYEISIQSGGKDDPQEHWFQAEREVTNGRQPGVREHAIKMLQKLEGRGKAK